MNPRTTPDPKELLNANTFWIKLVSKSKEIAEAKMQKTTRDKATADLKALLKDCGVPPADWDYYIKVIMDCPVANPW
jgi:hypothetical protein